MKRIMPRIARTALIAGAISLVVTVIIGLVQLFPDQPDLSYRSMDQHATLLRNGDLKIDQTIDVVMQDRDKPWRQLFQTYTVSDTGPTSITDVTVTNLSTGQKFTQGDGALPEGNNIAQWDATRANHWYLVDSETRQPYDPSSSGTKILELGWNIPATDHADSMRFAISMTWHGAATAYRDVAAMLWEPIAATNTVPVGVLTGTFTFPDGATRSNTWAWLHFTGTSSTKRTVDSRGNTQLHWQAWNVEANQYVDVQVMLDLSLTDNVQRHIDQNHKAAIFAREKADEQRWHNQQRNRARLIVAALALCLVVGVAALIAGGVSLKRRVHKWQTLHNETVYWRQSPELSPAVASKLSDLCQYDHEHRNLQVSATMLSLANLGIITLYPGKAQWYQDIPDDDTLSQQEQNAAYLRVLQERSANNTHGLLGGLLNSNRDANTCVTIVLHKNVHIDRELYDSEQSVVEFLFAVRRALGRDRFDTREIAHMKLKSLSNDTKKLLSDKSQAISTTIDTEFTALAVTRRAGVLTDCMAVLTIAAGVGFAVVSFHMSMGLVLLLAACVLWFFGLSLMMLNIRKELTDHGIQYAQQVIGLRNYMEDYSTFSARDVLSLTLWNNYLVYAVAMGIADTAMRQLMVNYPQEVSDPSWMDGYAAGSAMYWIRYSMLTSGTQYAAQGMNQDHLAQMATSFASSWNDFGTALGVSVTSLTNTIAVAGNSSSSGGSFSGGGFGGVSGGIGGGSFGGR